MAIYLKKFENHTQYENYINGSDAILPNVSICTTEGDVHYNPYVPPTPVETRVIAKFYVTNAGATVHIADEPSCFSSIEIDGVEQSEVTDSYDFSTVGEHTLKYTLIDPTIICDYTFEYCDSLTSIDIPNSVTSIGEQAIAYDYNLTSIEIPSGVTSIGEKAFNECRSLTSITVNATIPPTLGSNAFSNTNLSTIYVPSESVNAYKVAEGWRDYASDILPIP